MYIHVFSLTSVHVYGLLLCIRKAYYVFISLRQKGNVCHLTVLMITEMTQVNAGKLIYLLCVKIKYFVSILI